MVRFVFCFGYLLMVTKLISAKSAEDTPEISDSSFTLSVERTSICVNKLNSIMISCSLTKKDASAYSIGLSLFWLSEDKKVVMNATRKTTNESTLVSYLSVLVTWPDRRKFTCVGSRLNPTKNVRQRFLNRSVVVQNRPPAITIIAGLRFVEKATGKSVEVFWRPLNHTSTEYVLRHCAEDSENPDGPGCLYYHSFKAKCSVRHRDYYKVPNTTGLICKASFRPTTAIYTVHKIRVVTQVAGCDNVGAERRFHLAFWMDPSPSPDITEVVMIPHPVQNLRVVASRNRVVQLTWSDPWFVQGENSRIYTVGYNCSSSKVLSRRKVSRTRAVLSSADFRHYRPYDLCQFCVKARPYENGVDSESVCRFARLHEEAPTVAPRITCTGYHCKFTRDEMERNVTVTWTLPPKEEWNGLLTKLKVIYKELGNPQHKEHSVKNLTKGETVLTGLATNRSFIINMIVCNNEGCSGLSNASEIPMLSFALQPTPLPENSTENSMRVILVSSIGAPVFIFVTIYLVYISWKKLQEHRDYRSSMLPTIYEPDTYEQMKESAVTDTAQYDLHAHEHKKHKRTSTCTLYTCTVDDESKGEKQLYV